MVRLLLTAALAAAEPGGEPVAREPQDDEADAHARGELERLRVVVQQLRDDARSRRTTAGIVSLADGIASAGVGTYYTLGGGASTDATRWAGRYLVVRGAFAAGLGLVLLLGPEVRDLARLAAALDGRAAALRPSEALKEVELRWAEAADAARRERRTAGILALSLGTIGLGVGLVLPALAKDEPPGVVPALSVATVLTSSTLLTVGVEQLTVRADVERAWLAYRALKTTSAERVRFRLTPLAGGGVATIGVAF